MYYKPYHSYKYHVHVELDGIYLLQYQNLHMLYI